MQQSLAKAREVKEAAAEEQRKQADAAAVARQRSMAASLSVVPSAVQHARSLKDKKLWRRSAVINALMPSGANKVGTFPRR